MTVTAPDWAQGPSPTIHNPPAQPAVPGAPMSWQQLQATVQFFFDSIIGQIAISLGGIEIFGWKPLEFLADWGQQRIDEASQAYLAATNAQTSANTANTGVAQLFAIIDGLLSGGIHWSDTFDRSGVGIGPDYSERVYGPGAGGWGTNGFDLYWSPGGAVENTVHARRNVALSTDYQAAQIIVGVPAGGNTTATEVRMVLRENAAQDTHVIARLMTGLSGFDTVTHAEIGYTVGDTYTRLGAVEPVTFANGDRWEFRAGTAADDYEFQLYRNGALAFSRTDAAMASQMGAGYRYPGLGMRGGVSVSFFFFQVACTPIQAFAAGDRTPS